MSLPLGFGNENLRAMMSGIMSLLQDMSVDPSGDPPRDTSTEAPMDTSTGPSTGPSTGQAPSGSEFSMSDGTEKKVFPDSKSLFEVLQQTLSTCAPVTDPILPPQSPRMTTDQIFDFADTLDSPIDYTVYLFDKLTGCSYDSMPRHSRTKLDRLVGNPQVTDDQIIWRGASAVYLAKAIQKSQYASAETMSVGENLLYEPPSNETRYKLAFPDAVPPSRPRITDAGFDLCLSKYIKTENGVLYYSTGVMLEPPTNMWYMLVPRSSMAKTGYVMANGVGIIDPEYRGEVIVALRKIREDAADVPPHAKWVQIIPQLWHDVEMVPVEELNQTTRGATGGLGSQQFQPPVTGNSETLYNAVLFNDVATVKSILSASSCYRPGDIHWQNDRCLCEASKNGRTEIVQLLLDHGANVHTDNDSALRWASTNGHTDTVKVLLDHGAQYLSDALQRASTNGHTDTVKVLLDHGADVHIAGDSALRWASEKGYTDTVKVLLDHGADVHADNNYALRWASRHGHTDTVKVLLDYGADVHAENGQALQWASDYSHTAIVKLLLDHSENVLKSGVCLPSRVHTITRYS